MKRTLLATAAVLASLPAFAADLPPRVYAKAEPIQAYNWTGFYLGVSAGYAKDNADRTLLNATNANGSALQAFGITPTSLDTGIDGLVIGPQVGFNWQVGTIVYGLRAGFDFANLTDTHTTPGTLLNVAVAQDTKWTATLLARLGFTPTPQTLIYGIGGLAAVNSKVSVTPSGLICNIGGITCSGGTASGTDWGFAYGAGIEYAIDRSWTASLEWLRLDVDEKTVAISGGTPGFTAAYSSVHPATIDTLKLALNYRF